MRLRADTSNINKVSARRMSNNFRLNRKSALLTYANCTINVDFQEFHRVLALISPIKRIVIGREFHSLSGERHYHCYVEW